MQHGFDTLPTALRERARVVLERGEQVLWAGSPNWRAAWRPLLGAFVFGSFWCAISLPMLAMAVAGATGLAPIKFEGSLDWPLWARFAVPLFMLPFAVIGLAIISYPVYQIRTLLKTAHVVTNRRLLEIEPARIVSHPLPTISSLRVKPFGASRATLVLGLGWEKDSDGMLVEKTTEWFGVSAADAAEACIRSLAPRLSRATGSTK